jgi:aryl carrier-like protein
MPTEQTYEAVKKITALIQKELDAVKAMELIEIKRFNEQYVNLQLPIISGE